MIVKIRTCFHCDKEIYPEDLKFQLGIDFPYVNLWFHRECYKAISGNVVDYLLENSDKLIKEAEKFTRM